MEHGITRKPWGHEKVIFENGKSRTKLLFIRPRQKTSLQYHTAKTEAMMLIDGVGELFIGGITIPLDTPGKIHLVNPLVRHRLQAGLRQAVILEISHGEDSDIMRLDDEYGRTKANRVQKFASAFAMITLFVLAGCEELSLPAFAQEVVQVEGNKITITGDQPFDQGAYQDRQAKTKAIVDAELAHIRAVRLETAKFQTALMLERASAPLISVGAFASNETIVQQSTGKRSPNQVKE